MNTISSDFMGSFKLGDNIAYNFECLGTLFEIQRKGGKLRAAHVRKTIIITIASIAEAVLYDFYARMRGFTREGVDSVSDSVLDDVRTKHIDEFAKYIDHARSKSLLGADAGIYDDLHNLRMMRNRIHIQNRKGFMEPDESRAFNLQRQVFAEKTLETLLKVLERDHSRSKNTGNVEPFELPW
jgi:hypothetical protein